MKNPNRRFKLKKTLKDGQTKLTFFKILGYKSDKILGILISDEVFPNYCIERK